MREDDPNVPERGAETRRVRDLHDQAMELAQLALVARHTGDPQRAAALAGQAYPLEAQAADGVPDDAATEPTRGILYRSAAWLALDAGQPEEAIRLAERGLAGHPPAEIAAELNAALATARLIRRTPTEGDT